jgi:hypothetical protein
MKRSAIFLAVLMFSALVTVLLANFSPAEAGGGNCQSKLVGKSFDCNAKDSQGGTGSACIKFESGGISKNFDLLISGDDFGCACDTTGSFNSPSFNASSSSFECLGIAAGFLTNGKVKGKKVTAQQIDESGNTDILSCTERSSACP